MTARSTATCSAATAGGAVTLSMVSPRSPEITHANHLKSNRKPVRSTVSLPQQRHRLSLVSTPAFRMFSRKVKVNGARLPVSRFASFVWIMTSRPASYSNRAHWARGSLQNLCSCFVPRVCMCVWVNQEVIHSCWWGQNKNQNTMRKCTGNKYREETLYDNVAVLEMRVLFLD